jgi:RNA polymerase-binding transcription factor
MDDERARALLRTERANVERLLAETTASGSQDREAEQEQGDASDPAQSLAAQGVDDAVAASLRERLAALDRAEQRLAAGNYGRSIRSGTPIPDARLEADPTAELTVEEANAS